jgi:uncharacterized protein (DUF362 family)
MAVYFDEVTKYQQSMIEESIRRGFGEINVDLSGRKSAFIKVNIVRPAKPKSCIVTNPVVVEALIKVLRDRGVEKIIVGDGSAIGVNADTAFKTSGFLKLSKKMNVKLLDINTAKCTEKEWDHGMLKLPTELLESDIYINVPKMKTHFHAGVTLSIKNQQGLLSPADKRENHRTYDLHQSLVSIAKVIRPDLIIVDAIESMEGEGPTKGTPKRTNALVYGKDMLETDVACCYFMDVAPSGIEHLGYAKQANIGNYEPEIKGEAFAKLRTKFEMPSPMPKQILNFYSWKNYHACAEDEHSFDKALHLAYRTPKYWFTFLPKFLYFVVFNKFHLLRGKHAKMPGEPGRVLCIGNCCKETADKNGAYFVPGCPPKPEDIIKTIQRMK